MLIFKRFTNVFKNACMNYCMSYPVAPSIVNCFVISSKADWTSRILKLFWVKLFVNIGFGLI